MSTTIYVIRHGDKPVEEGAKPYGVKDSGEEDFRSLLVRGWQRAGCWVAHFFPPPGATFAGLTPEDAYVYASARETGDADGAPSDATAEKDGSKSRRPVETVTALAARLRSKKHPGRPRTPNQDYTKGQEAEVAAAAVAREEADVVICWQHENIGSIVNAVTGTTTIPAGDLWRSDCFNGVVVLARDGEGWTASQSAPVQLDGDTAEGPYGSI